MSRKPTHLRVVQPSERAIRPRYKPPDLDGHKVAFKGKRFWVIELEEGRHFDYHYKEIADFVVYDKADSLTIAWASRTDGGGFKVSITYGPHVLDYDAERIEDLGRVANAALDRVFRDDERELRQRREPPTLFVVRRPG